MKNLLYCFQFNLFLTGKYISHQKSGTLLTSHRAYIIRNFIINSKVIIIKNILLSE